MVSASRRRSTVSGLVLVLLVLLTGPITVVTPAGKSKSKKSFTVT